MMHALHNCLPFFVFHFQSIFINPTVASSYVATIKGRTRSFVTYLGLQLCAREGKDYFNYKVMQLFQPKTHSRAHL